jgi:hypothetical protein
MAEVGIIFRRFGQRVAEAMVEAGRTLFMLPER